MKNKSTKKTTVRHKKSAGPDRRFLFLYQSMIANYYSLCLRYMILVEMSAFKTT